MSSPLVRKASVGGLYIGLKVVVVHGLGVARLAVLARLLNPEALGVYGTALVLLMLADVLMATGTDLYLIQSPRLDTARIGTAWSIRIGAGVLASVLFAAMTPLYVTAIDTESARPVLYVMAVVPVLRGLVNPAVILAEREVRMGRVAAFEVLVSASEVGGAILGAWLTNSAVGLAWGIVVSVSLTAVASQALFPRAALPSWNPAAAREVAAVGKNVWVAALGGYITLQADNLLVAKILGAAALGVYLMAFQLAQWPVQIFSHVVNRVMRAALSRRGADGGSGFPAAVRDYVSVATCLLFFVVLGLGGASKAVVLIVMGPDWAPAVLVFQILLVQALGRSLAHVYDVVIVARGAYPVMARAKLIEVPIFLVAVLVGTVYYGLPGAAVGSAIGYLVAALARMPFTVHASEFGYDGFIKDWLSSLIHAGIALLVAWLAAGLVDGRIARFVVYAAVYSVAWIGLLRVWPSRTWSTLAGLGHGLRRGPQRGSE